jgi:hypothetical protein
VPIELDVRDSHGHPRVGATVRLLKNGVVVAEEVVGASGMVTFHSLVEGDEHTVHVHDSDYFLEEDEPDGSEC